MNAGERIDLIRVFDDDPGAFDIGTVELVRDVDEELVNKLIKDAWPLFQFGPDETDYVSEDEYHDALDLYGGGEPDSDSQFVEFLVKHHGDIFKIGSYNTKIFLD